MTLELTLLTLGRRLPHRRAGRALARNADATRALTLALPSLRVLLPRRAAARRSSILIYYGLPEVPGIKETWIWFLIARPMPIAVLALSLNSAGYLTEILAGAMRNVPAARSRRRAPSA